MGQAKSRCLREDKVDCDKKGEDPTNTSDQRAKNDPRATNKIDKERQKTIQECMNNSEKENAKLLQEISKSESDKVSISDDGIEESRNDLQNEHLLLLEHHAQLVSRDIKQRMLISNLQKENEQLRQSSDLEIQVKQLSNEITMKEQLVMKLETELKDLRLENERLADQLVSTKERVAGDGQEILQQSGELNEKVRENLKVDLQPSEKTVRRNIPHEVGKLDFLCKYLGEKSHETLMAEKKIIKKIKDQLDKSQSITELKLNLENELSPEFSAQFRRLNSLVKIGQDVLMAEQEILKKLKAEPEETKATAEIPSNVVEATPANLQENINRRNKKRKVEDVDAIDEEEEEAREKNLVSDCSIQDVDCQLCSKMEQNCSLNPIKINMNYWIDSYDKQLILVVDTNVIIDFVDLLCDFLSCKIDDCYPIVLIPYMVVKELDSIRKDKNKVNRAQSIKCNFAMLKLEQCMRETTRVLEQSLEQMKISSIIEFKKKDADDTITECCVALKKSANNVLLWTEDINLRLKVLGHRIPAVKQTEILQILQHGTKNPLRKIMLQEDNLVVVKDILAQLPAHLILDMLRDPKNTILLLTEHGENFPRVRESEIKFEETRARSTSIGDLNLDSLFETE